MRRGEGGDGEVSGGEVRGEGRGGEGRHEMEDGVVCTMPK